MQEHLRANDGGRLVALTVAVGPARQGLRLGGAHLGEGACRVRGELARGLVAGEGGLEFLAAPVQVPRVRSVETDILRAGAQVPLGGVGAEGRDESRDRVEPGRSLAARAEEQGVTPLEHGEGEPVAAFEDALLVDSPGGDQLVELAAVATDGDEPEGEVLADIAQRPARGIHRELVDELVDGNPLREPREEFFAVPLPVDLWWHVLVRRVLRIPTPTLLVFCHLNRDLLTPQNTTNPALCQCGEECLGGFLCSTTSEKCGARHGGFPLRTKLINDECASFAGESK